MGGPQPHQVTRSNIEKAIAHEILADMQPCLACHTDKSGRCPMCRSDAFRYASIAMTLVYQVFDSPSN